MQLEIQTIEVEDLMCPELSKMVIGSAPNILLAASVWLEGPCQDETEKVMVADLLEYREEFVYWLVGEGGRIVGSRTEVFRLVKMVRAKDDHFVPAKQGEQGDGWISLREDFPNDMPFVHAVGAWFSGLGGSFSAELSYMYPWPKGFVLGEPQ